MLDANSILKNLKRPKLLVSAARFGLDDFRRDQSLKRILLTDKLPKTREALIRLIGLEAALEDERKTHAASYCLSRHIEVLTAIMFEQRLLSTNNSVD